MNETNVIQWHGYFYSNPLDTFLISVTLTYHLYHPLQSVGLGKLRPNVLLMGFKSDWQTASQQAVADYFAIIQ